ncbi:holin family protein [Jhaorihella thermophila]|uniref:Holin of 3TMs, for gene-transfer release n=1 Tax=Jhaorihella thermophila TaxID=488547 RepID=A0A1H5SL80_9RHOB|nr:holin family protein [Jhaorihella thermophila]SEF51336.1 Holin of 3TMs, for gene-transfer release [Jhaorihella thermophila]
MGLIADLWGALFGGGRNVVRETAEVFIENAEARGRRAAELRATAMAQFAAEFGQPPRGRFDRFMDGLNRLPRPALALGALGLFVAAMVDPLWFAARMQGLAVVPEPLWWLLGVVVSFYFGARHQAKAQDFQRDLAATMARAPAVLHNLAEIERLRDEAADLAGGDSDPNPALEEWRRRRRAAAAVG